MSFLTDTGLSYFYGKLKEKFIQSVNGETGDTNGNVQINQVPLAENLTSPDAQASIDTFVYRTSGGSASLTSGDANLIFINGNMTITGRIEENASVSSNSELIVSISNINTLRTAVDNTSGTYIIKYIAPTSDIATEAWEPSSGNWEYNDETTSLSMWGLVSTEPTLPTLSINVSGEITAGTVVPDTFITAISNQSDTYIFTYINENWSLNNTEIVLSNYGIDITGTPEESDTIIVTYTAGTMDTSVTLNFTAYNPGSLNVATPTSFKTTGFNQFDKNSTDPNQSGVINNATIEDGIIVANNGTYVCYCRAVGGTHGYIAESIGGYINTTGGMGWCNDVPEIGSTIITTSADNSDSVTTHAADFTYLMDGYIVVVTTNTSDLMMWCEWSGDVNGQTTYTPYTAPTTVNIPTIGVIDGTQYYLPTYTYGMPKLGNVYDTINFESNTYIKRIEQLAYSAENLAAVQAMTPVPVYDYDLVNIFYVRETPLTYTFTSTSNIIYVDDHGTEEFIGTTIGVTAELLYGQNLRDKLRTDVLTISEQTPSLNSTQLKRIYDNLSLLNYIYPVGSIYMSVNNTSPATLFGGTWQQITDRFILAAGSTYGAGTTGGAATHTHTTGNCTLTISQIPSHSHTVSNPQHYFYTSSGADCTPEINPNSGYTWKTFNTSNGYTGGGGAHNHGSTGSTSNLPPYLAVYVWKRTA